jgi:hypothetical protein
VKQPREALEKTREALEKTIEFNKAEIADKKRQSPYDQCSS